MNVVPRDYQIAKTSNDWTIMSAIQGFLQFLPSILTIQFKNCVKFNFGKSYLPSDSHTNTVISDHFA